MIIFDFDGVLVESVDVKTRAFAELFEPEGPDIVQKVLQYHLENGGLSRYEKFRYVYHNFLRRPLPESGMTELGRRFSDLVVTQVVNAPLVKGAREFV
jgi:beta-phosphoglucomutase-like phosphatase (HAD superfamily)